MSQLCVRLGLFLTSIGVHDCAGEGNVYITTIYLGGIAGLGLSGPSLETIRELRILILTSLSVINH